MKKIVVIILICLSASTALAQFGNLKDVINQEKQGVDTTLKAGVRHESQFGVSILEKALKEGLVCIKQDFQLEDTLTGTLYNFDDNPNEFGGQTSFMVKLNHGFIIPDEIMHPWNYDPNYPKFKNQQYVPIINRTSLLTVSQNDWHVLDIPFWPTEKYELANGLKYVTDEKTISDGFNRFTGLGKKEVWVVWLLIKDQGSREVQCEFVTEQVELTIEESNKLYEMKAPTTKQHILGGIVVEPVFNGIGRVDFALVGVIGKGKEEFKMAVLESSMELNNNK